MRILCAAVVLGLLTASCARKAPETPVSTPQGVVTEAVTEAVPAQPEPAQPVPPAAQPVASVSPPPEAAAAPPASTPAPAPAPRTAGKTTPPVSTPPVATQPAVKKPAATAGSPKPAAPTPAAPAVAAPSAPAAQPLDLNALKERLKATRAIGIFTKIALKNQVDDLMQRFGEYHRGKANVTVTDLRQSYNLLMMKVLSLLQDGDPPLASAIVSSREAIWGLLANPTTFATLQA